MILFRCTPSVFLSVLIGALCLVWNLCCSTRLAGGTGTEIGHGAVVGTLYEPCGTRLAVHADVRLRLASTIADSFAAVQLDADSGKTDRNGAYSFDAVDTGTYVVEGFDAANNRVLIGPVHLATADSTKDLGPDTLEPAGAIQGKINLSEGGDPRKVLILSISIDRSARVNADGSFVFPDLARGSYTIRILPLLQDYEVLDTGGIVVRSSDTTDLGVMSPIFIGIPTPRNISLSYDSLLQVVTVRWSTADPRLVTSYNVYRRNIDSARFVPINPSPVSDTVFRDSTGVQGMTYEYAVVAVDSFGNEGLKSAGVSATIRSSFVLVKTIDVSQFSSTVVKAISTPDNRLYVLSRALTSGLFVLDSSGKVVDTIGARLFTDPYDMAVDSAGEVFVTDYALSTIFKFDAKGAFVSRWSVNFPGFVTTIVDSTLIIGTSAGVEMFSLAGIRQGSFPLSNPDVKGIAQSSDGNLFVYNNFAVMKFSRSGTLLDSVYGITVDSLKTYNDEAYLLKLKQNLLLFAFNKQLFRIDEQGKLLSKATFPGVPAGMFVDEQKNTVLICDLLGYIRIYQR